MHRTTLIAPIVFLLIGVGTWALGNVLGDRQGGTNIALIIVGGGVGLAKQGTGSSGSTVSGGNIESVKVEQQPSTTEEK